MLGMPVCNDYRSPQIEYTHGYFSKMSHWFLDLSPFIYGFAYIGICQRMLLMVARYIHPRIAVRNPIGNPYPRTTQLREHESALGLRIFTCERMIDKEKG